MKTMKKSLSIIMALMMLMTMVSVAMTSFAAAQMDVSAVPQADWDALFAAVGKSYVQTADYGARSATNANPYLRTATDNAAGDIETAVLAFNVIARKITDTGKNTHSTVNDNNTSYEVVETMYNYAVTNYAAELAAAGCSQADFQRIMKMFIGDPYIYGPTTTGDYVSNQARALRTYGPSGTTAPQDGQPTRFTLNRNAKSILMGYANVAAFPANNQAATSSSWTWTHARGSNSGSTRSHYINGAGNVAALSNANAAVTGMAEIKAYAAAIGDGSGFKTADELRAMGYADMAAVNALYTSVNNAINGLNNVAATVDAEVRAHFGLLDVGVATAYRNLLAYFLPAYQIGRQIPFYTGLDMAKDFSLDNDLGALQETLYLLDKKNRYLDKFNIFTTPSTMAMLQAEYGFPSKAELDAYRAGLQARIEILQLTPINNYFKSQLPVIAAGLGSWTKEEALGFLNSLIPNYAAATSGYSSAAINAVFGTDTQNGYEYLADVNWVINELKPVVGDDAAINKAFELRAFFNPARLSMDPGVMPDAIVKNGTTMGKELEDSQAKLNEMLALCGTPAAIDELFGAGMYDKVLAHIQAVGTEMGIRIAEDLEDAIDRWTDDGSKMTQMTYRYWNSLFGSGIMLQYYNIITKAEYAGKNFVPAYVSSNWSKVAARLAEYNTVTAAKGFTGAGGAERYVSTVPMTYPTSVEMPGNKVKVGATQYTVEEAALNSIITRLDTFLNSATLGDILETFDVDLPGGGEFTGLGNLVKGLLNDSLYSSDLVNSLVSFIYPMLVNDVLWPALRDDIPPTYEVLCQNIAVRAPIFKALPNLGIAAYPQHLKNTINRTRFPYLYNQLNSVSDPDNDATNIYDERAWNTFRVYDDEDEMVPDSTLQLDWRGPDGKDVCDRESFIEALASALSGVNGLLRASLTNTAWHGSTTIASLVTVNADLPAGYGYNKGFMPLLEMLECPGIVSSATFSSEANARANNYNSTYYMLSAILNPLLGWVENQLAANPLDILIGQLPNIAYGMIYDMIPGVLGSLLSGELVIADSCGFLDAIREDIGAQLDIPKLLAEQGISLTSLDGLVGSVLGLAGVPTYDANKPPQDNVGAIVAPSINTEILSSLGKMKELSSSRTAQGGQTAGVRHTIDADNAAVLYSILTWVCKAVGNKPFVDGIIGMISKDDSEPLSDTVMDILAGVSNDPDATVTALVELLVPKKYDMFDVVNQDDLAIAKAGGADPTVVTAEYSDIWTINHARYLAYHLDSFLNDAFKLLFGRDLEDFLDEFLGESVFTHDILKQLFDMIDEALAGDEDSDPIDLDEYRDIVDQIEPLLNIPISPIFDLLKTDVSALVFEDGNRAQFMAAVIDLLKPLQPLLAVLLSGKDIEVADGLVKVLGYQGYAYGLLPILEALGCTAAQGLKTPAQFEGDPDNILKNILTPLLAQIDVIMADPMAAITSILPNVLYFAQSGSLQAAIDNILFPVYVVLDVIRPIYDVNLNLQVDLLDLVGGLLEDALGMDLPFGTLDQLATGTKVVATSLNGNEYVRLSVSETGSTNVDDRAAFLTNLLRTALNVLLYSDNMKDLRDMIAKYGQLDDGNLDAVNALLDRFQLMSVDTILYVAFYIFYGLDRIVDNTNKKLEEANAWLKTVSEVLAVSEGDSLKTASTVARELLKKYFSDVIGGEDPPVVAPNGFVAFLYSILNFFRRIFGLEPLPVPLGK